MGHRRCPQVHLSFVVAVDAHVKSAGHTAHFFFLRPLLYRRGEGQGRLLSGTFLIVLALDVVGLCSASGPWAGVAACCSPQARRPGPDPAFVPTPL